MNQQHQADEARVYFEKRTLLDGRHREIVELCPIDGEGKPTLAMPAGVARFAAQVTWVPAMRLGQRLAPRTVSFAINAESVAEAFAQYDAAKQKAIEQDKAQFQKELRERAVDPRRG